MTYYRFLETDGMVLFQEIQVNCQSRGLEQYGSPPSVAESGGGVREREREIVPAPNHWKGYPKKQGLSGSTRQGLNHSLTVPTLFGLWIHRDLDQLLERVTQFCNRP